MKFELGYIKNLDGRKKSIVVKSALPNKAKDILIGAAIVGTGIAYLTSTAFKYGAVCFNDAELETLAALDLI